MSGEARRGVPLAISVEPLELDFEHDHRVA